jgi:hypothetical protein
MWVWVAYNMLGSYAGPNMLPGMQQNAPHQHCTLQLAHQCSVVTWGPLVRPAGLVQWGYRRVVELVVEVWGVCAAREGPELVKLEWA